MNLSFITFVSVITASLAVSLCSLSGLFALWLKPETLKQVVPYLVALAVGVLLGDAFIHLIPDAVNRHGSVAEVCLMTLVGVFCFFVLEKIVRWRHDHRQDFTGAQDEIRPMAKIPALHEHSTIPNLIGQSTIFALGIGFMQSIIVLEHFLLNP